MKIRPTWRPKQHPTDPRAASLGPLIVVDVILPLHANLLRILKVQHTVRMNFYKYLQIKFLARGQQKS